MLEGSRRGIEVILVEMRERAGHEGPKGMRGREEGRWCLGEG